MTHLLILLFLSVFQSIKCFTFGGPVDVIHAIYGVDIPTNILDNPLSFFNLHLHQLSQASNSLNILFFHDLTPISLLLSSNSPNELDISGLDTSSILEALEKLIASGADEFSTKISASKSALEDEQLKQSFQEFTAASEKLVSDVWNIGVLKKLDAAVNTLDNSPLFETSKSTIENLKSTLIPSLVKSTEVDIKQGINTLSQSVSQKALDDFYRVLNSDPSYRLSTSEFTNQYVNEVVIPKTNEVVDFLAKSPLASETNKIGSSSTSKVFNDVVSTIVDKSTPAMDVAVNIGTRVVKGFVINPVSSIAGGLEKTIQDSLASISVPSPDTNDFSLTSIQSTINPSTIVLPPVDIEKQASQALETVTSTVTTKAFPAVGRAFTVFGQELSKSGDVLSGNIAKFGENLGNVAEATVSKTGETITVAEKLISSIPSSTSGVLEDVENILPQIPDKTVESLNYLQIRAGSTAETIANSAKNKVEYASQWKFFSDDEHWKNGYWEQQILKTQHALEGLKNKDPNDVVNELLSNAGSALNKASERFEKINEENLKAKGLYDPTIISKLASLPSGATSATSAIANTIEGVVRIVDSQVKDITADEALHDSVLSVAQELRSILKESNNYVKDFIDTNQDLSY
eukprot:gene9869-13276_t